MLLRYLAFVIILIVSLLLAACGNTETTPTQIPLQESPTPVDTEIPPTATQTEVEQILQSISNLCLEVTQDFPNIEEEFSLPIQATVKRTLSELGYNIIEDGGGCEGVLSIDVIGKSIRRDYINAPEGCYTGVKINGQVTLTVGNFDPITQPIFFQKPTAGGLLLKCPNESEAPYDRSWQKAVYAGISMLFGIEALQQALDDEEIGVSCAAASLIGSYGSDANAEIPRLVEIWFGVLENGDRIEMCADSYRALREITGLDLGYSEEDWLEWWEKNK